MHGVALLTKEKKALGTMCIVYSPIGPKKSWLPDRITKSIKHTRTFHGFLDEGDIIFVLFSGNVLFRLLWLHTFVDKMCEKRWIILNVSSCYYSMKVNT